LKYEGEMKSMMPISIFLKRKYQVMILAKVGEKKTTAGIYYDLK